MLSKIETLRKVHKNLVTLNDNVYGLRVEGVNEGELELYVMAMQYVQNYILKAIKEGNEQVIICNDELNKAKKR